MNAGTQPPDRPGSTFAGRSRAAAPSWCSRWSRRAARRDAADLPDDRGRTRRARAGRAHERQCWPRSRNINRAVLNAETGQRGYLITLDRRYLAPYRVGARAVSPGARAACGGCSRPTAPPRQRELLDEIENLDRPRSSPRWAIRSRWSTAGDVLDARSPHADRRRPGGDGAAAQRAARARDDRARSSWSGGGRHARSAEGRVRAAARSRCSRWC